MILYIHSRFQTLYKTFHFFICVQWYCCNLSCFFLLDVHYNHLPCFLCMKVVEEDEDEAVRSVCLAKVSVVCTPFDRYLFLYLPITQLEQVYEMKWSIGIWHCKSGWCHRVEKSMVSVNQIEHTLIPTDFQRAINIFMCNKIGTQKIKDSKLFSIN